MAAAKERITSFRLTQAEKMAAATLTAMAVATAAEQTEIAA